MYTDTIGLLSGDILHVLFGFIYVHRLTGTRPRIFHAFITPAACAILLYCTARLFFFQLLAFGASMLAAMLVSLLLCVILYLFLLRLLGVRIVSYFKRVVLMANG